MLINYLLRAYNKLYRLSSFLGIFEAVSKLSIKVPGSWKLSVKQLALDENRQTQDQGPMKLLKMPRCVARRLRRL